MSAIDDFSPSDSAMTIGKTRAWGEIHGKKYGDGSGNSVSAVDLVAVPEKVASLEAAMEAKADLVDGKVPVEQLPDGIGGGGGDCLVESVNGKTGEVVIDLDDLPEVSAAVEECATAISTKADLVDGTVPKGQLPANDVTSVQGKSGAVTLALADFSDISNAINARVGEAPTDGGRYERQNDAWVKSHFQTVPGSDGLSYVVRNGAFVNAANTYVTALGATAAVAINAGSSGTVTCTPGGNLAVTITDTGADISKIVALAIVPTAACNITWTYSGGTILWKNDEELTGLAAGEFGYVTIDIIMGRCVINVVYPEG